MNMQAFIFMDCPLSLFSFLPSFFHSWLSVPFWSELCHSIPFTIGKKNPVFHFIARRLKIVFPLPQLPRIHFCRTARGVWTCVQGTIRNGQWVDTTTARTFFAPQKRYEQSQLYACLHLSVVFDSFFVEKVSGSETDYWKTTSSDNPCMQVLWGVERLIKAKRNKAKRTQKAPRILEIFETGARLLDFPRAHLR